MNMARWGFDSASRSEMNLLDSLKERIAETLSTEKAYNLPARCVSLGLAGGEEAEAFSSKRLYVLARIKGLGKEPIITLARQTLEIYPGTYALEETVDLIDPPRDGLISAITRRHLIDALDQMGNLAGGMRISEFLGRMFPLSQMPYRSLSWDLPTFQEAVFQHMIRNDDWSYKEFFDLIGLINVSERRFRKVLEHIVHPEVRTGAEQERFVSAINEHVIREGFELQAFDQTAGYPIFRIVKRGGVLGHCKNLIFAANGPKPELVLADALNNDLRIVKHEEFCLVYDRPIGLDGLRWKELTEWWHARGPAEDSERLLYKRLFASLASEPEKSFFRLYFQTLRDVMKDALPALVPQVYLHYDPYTLRDHPNGSPLARQRMDFLLLLPHRQRVVIELDGKQHYADGEVASPRKYAELVAEDRALRLSGYEVYRFGGHELTFNADGVVVPFLRRLLLQ